MDWQRCRRELRPIVMETYDVCTNRFVEHRCSMGIRCIDVGDSCRRTVKVSDIRFQIPDDTKLKLMKRQLFLLSFKKRTIATEFLSSPIEFS